MNTSVSMLDPGGLSSWLGRPSRAIGDTAQPRLGVHRPVQVHDPPVSLYSPNSPPFSNITPLVSSLGWTPFAASTAVEYFNVQGIGWLFTSTQRHKSTMGRMLTVAAPANLEDALMRNCGVEAGRCEYVSCSVYRV